MPPGRGVLPGERGVHPVAGVDQAEAIGAEQPHALGGAEAGDLRLAFGALGPVSRKPAVMMAIALVPARRQS